jgi:hypothetical protein
MAKTERARKFKGCFDFKTKSYRIDNVLFDSCVGNYAVPIEYYVEAFRLYEKGVLPFEGGVGEQPNKIMAIFQLIEARRTEVFERQDRTERMANKQRGR